MRCYCAQWAKHGQYKSGYCAICKQQYILKAINKLKYRTTRLKSHRHANGSSCSCSCSYRNSKNNSVSNANACVFNEVSNIPIAALLCLSLMLLLSYALLYVVNDLVMSWWLLTCTWVESILGLVNHACAAYKMSFARSYWTSFGRGVLL